MKTIKPIRARLKEIELERAKLIDEEKELLITVKVLERLGVPIADQQNASFSSQTNSPAKNGMRNRDCIIQALKDSGNPWLTAAEIQEHASAIKGSQIPMSSISPGLTELKNESLIVRRGFRVALVSRSNEDTRSVEKIIASDTESPVIEAD